jgi:hypothetical protein
VTWLELNAALREARTEAAVRKLVDEEMRQEYPRERWVRRMMARYRYLKYLREKKEEDKMMKGVRR